MKSSLKRNTSLKVGSFMSMRDISTSNNGYGTKYESTTSHSQPKYESPAIQSQSITKSALALQKKTDASNDNELTQRFMSKITQQVRYFLHFVD